MRKTLLVVIMALVFLVSNFSISFADIKTFVKEYTYQASELDSKVSSRVITLEIVKRQLLEELGTFLTRYQSSTGLPVGE
ncbi:MAG: hypothetical protein FD156_2548 [Nitrospirae bacterium]|nr:MAG: hypothetical protein FD156_2548 [Nitrospirota bacterium]